MQHVYSTPRDMYGSPMGARLLELRERANLEHDRDQQDNRQRKGARAREIVVGRVLKSPQISTNISPKFQKVYLS